MMNEWTWSRSISLLWFRVKPFLVSLFSMWSEMMLLCVSRAEVNGMLAPLHELWRMKTAPHDAFSRSDLWESERECKVNTKYSWLSIPVWWPRSVSAINGSGQPWQVWSGVSGVMHQSVMASTQWAHAFSRNPSAADVFNRSRARLGQVSSWRRRVHCLPSW